MKNNPNKVIIPCRFSYLHCWEPDSVNGGDPRYSVSAIISKSDTRTVRRSGGSRECQEGIAFQVGRQDPPEPEAAPARRRHRAPG